MDTARMQKIGAAERSGVLQPANLERFSAQWIPSAADVREVIETYWTVQWQLGENESIDQRVIDHPSITLTIERGDVLAPYVVSAFRTKAWMRTIAGKGVVFALRLRPAGLAVLTDMDPLTLAGEQEITATSDARAYRLLEQIAAAPDGLNRGRRADALIREHLAERPLTSQQLLANDAVNVLTDQPHVRPLGEIAAGLHTSQRSLQRALRATLGRGPNETARRIRLQEVVRRLSSRDPDISLISADLGYTDQAHLTNEFRSVAGVTPGAYLASLKRAEG